jgi:hypothetical protein
MLEIKRYPGRLIYRYSGEMVYYLNQLDWFDGIPYPDDPEKLTWEDNEWIAANFMDRYLHKNYGIGSKEYYNLIHGLPINYHKLCDVPGCGKPVKFRTLWHGYRSTCSYECRDKLQSDRMIEWYATASDEERQQFLDAQHQWWWDDNYKSEFIDLFGFSRKVKTSTKVVATWNFKKYLFEGSLIDNCNFYIAKTATQFKFGITNEEYYIGWNKDYLKRKILFWSNRLRVASLEYLIKLDLDIDTEYLDWNRVSEFRESYLKYYNLTINQKFNDYPVWEYIQANGSARDLIDQDIV